MPPPGERRPKGDANTEKNRAKRRKGDELVTMAFKRPAPDVPLRFIYPDAFLFCDR